MACASLRLGASLFTTKKCDIDYLQVSGNENLPKYSVIIALYKEPHIINQLVKAMRRLNYPMSRLEIIFALEADDFETIKAFKSTPLSKHMRVLLVPYGTPRTKPRALNYALERANGDLVVIYDAEDLPDPDQLFEAAERFNTSDKDLACLQAPLRPYADNSFIARQFSAEYAVQFGIVLPALERLGLNFPLGGTSNHFKTRILRSIGGWDKYNVTEDADLGIRLARLGFKASMISKPTLESTTTSLKAWLPQRTRWIKGYMQTILVHLRNPNSLNLKVLISIILTIGLSVISALLYAPFFAYICTNLLLQILSGQGTRFPIMDLSLLLIGTLSSMLALREGCKRIGARFSAWDMLASPFYWCLISVAAFFAVYQLLTKPFHWDKTEHNPVVFTSNLRKTI